MRWLLTAWGKNHHERYLALHVQKHLTPPASCYNPRKFATSRPNGLRLWDWSNHFFKIIFHLNLRFTYWREIWQQQRNAPPRRIRQFDGGYYMYMGARPNCRPNVCCNNLVCRWHALHFSCNSPPNKFVLANWGISSVIKKTLMHARNGGYLEDFKPMPYFYSIPLVGICNHWMVFCLYIITLSRWTPNILSWFRSIVHHFCLLLSPIVKRWDKSPFTFIMENMRFLYQYVSYDRPWISPSLHIGTLAIP